MVLLCPVDINVKLYSGHLHALANASIYVAHGCVVVAMAAPISTALSIIMLK
jgi:hypothetical protein